MLASCSSDSPEVPGSVLESKTYTTTEQTLAITVDGQAPAGAMTVEFEDVSAVSPVYDVHLSGRMTVYPDDKERRSADVTITMRDFDKTVAYLQKNTAKVPQFGQAAFGLLMMKGLARDTGDGAQAWDLTVGEDGKVLINGQPLPFQQ